MGMASFAKMSGTDGNDFFHRVGNLRVGNLRFWREAVEQDEKKDGKSKNDERDPKEDCRGKRKETEQKNICK